MADRVKNNLFGEIVFLEMNFVVGTNGKWTDGKLSIGVCELMFGAMWTIGGGNILTPSIRPPPLEWNNVGMD